MSAWLMRLLRRTVLDRRALLNRSPLLAVTAYLQGPRVAGWDLHVRDTDRLLDRYDRRELFQRTMRVFAPAGCSRNFGFATAPQRQMQRHIWRERDADI